MIHAGVTLLVALAAGFLAGYWDAGLMAAAFYAGREHAQAEYRWIEHHGGGRRANMPWWGGFDLKVWSLKSALDWALPVVVAVIFSVVM